MTIACCIAACLPDPLLWRIQILGTDIGVAGLSRAKKATFGQRAMQHVPEEYCRRFFLKAKDSPSSRRAARSDRHDQLSPAQLDGAARRTPFDLVPLKNVLIYFDAASKTTVLHHVRRALVPGGLLLAGAAEGVSNMLSDFERLEAWLFRKPAL